MWSLIFGFCGYFCGIVITLLICVAVTLSERKKMLVLSRKPCPEQDTIDIDNGRIQVRILEVRRNGTVRIGITADPDINVAREEVLVTAALDRMFVDSVE